MNEKLLAKNIIRLPLTIVSESLPWNFGVILVNTVYTVKIYISFFLNLGTMYAV